MRLNGGDNVCFFWIFSRERNPSDYMGVFLDWLILLPTCISFDKKRSQQCIKLWLDLAMKWNSDVHFHFLALFFYYFSTKNKRQTKTKKNNKNQIKPNKTKHNSQNENKKTMSSKIPIFVVLGLELWKNSPWEIKCSSVYSIIKFCCAWLSSHTYFSHLLSILRVWLLFFPCLIIPVIIHDRTSALKRSASKLIKWNDSLMSALWRDGYEQASILDDACNLCLDLLRNRWAVLPQHFT